MCGRSVGCTACRVQRLLGFVVNVLSIVGYIAIREMRCVFGDRFNLAGVGSRANSNEAYVENKKLPFKMIETIEKGQKRLWESNGSLPKSEIDVNKLVNDENSPPLIAFSKDT